MYSCVVQTTRHCKQLRAPVHLAPLVLLCTTALILCCQKGSGCMYATVYCVQCVQCVCVCTRAHCVCVHCVCVHCVCVHCVCVCTVCALCVCVCVCAVCESNGKLVVLYPLVVLIFFSTNLLVALLLADFHNCFYAKYVPHSNTCKYSLIQTCDQICASTCTQGTTLVITYNSTVS